MTWQKNGTSITLGSPADALTITNLIKLKFNQFLTHALNDGGGDTRIIFRVGDGSIDSGSNYARRTSFDGATDSGASTTSTFYVSTIDASDEFNISYASAISGEELLLILFAVENNGTGAANAPSRVEVVGKWVTTTQINHVEALDDQSGSYDTDSNISALGTN